VLRRVIGQKVVGLSGPRALLMHAAHPVAFAGFFAHTGALDEPYERLRRTARVLDLIAFGRRGSAQRAARRVRAMHRRVRGELAVRIVVRPPVPARMRPLVELTNQITVGLLPAPLRRAYGFRWDPVRAVVTRGGAEYAKRVVVPLLPERIRLPRSAQRAA